MTQNEFKTIFEAFKTSCEINAQKTAICYKENNVYASLTYRELYNQTLDLAGFLKKNNINSGSHIAIILENSRYWPIAFFSIMGIGATAIPISPQTEQTELTQLIIHSDTKIILTTADIAQKLKETTKNLSIPIFSLDQLVLTDIGDSHKKRDSHLCLGQLARTENGDCHAFCDCHHFSHHFSPTQPASIVYTSGTTATPKGVILTHENLLSNFDSLKQLNLITPDDCLICILPLHHTYPFMINLLLPLLLGCKISFPQNLNLEELLDCLTKTNVTIFIGVPRIFALLHEKIKNNLKELSCYKKHLLNASLSIALLIRKHLQINLAKSILARLHHKFGTRLRAMASGGAKLNAQVAKDFYKWGFSILEGYGLTETSPVLTFNMPDNFEIGSVGKPIPGVEIKIHQPDQAGIGEIIAKGKNITSGYYKDTTASQESIKDGWFFTRDLGYIDKNGFIFITGRKNETIVLSSGKKISPEELESFYIQSPYVKEICIFLPAAAQDKDLLTAVILPNLDYFRDQGLAQIKHRIRIEVENLSLKLPAFKRIKKYITISETLPKTLLGKVKRFEVAKKYSQEAQIVEETPKTELSAEDKLLLSVPLCQNALEHLSQRVKKPVNLNDHLELDLGMDSLERINLFFELKKIAGFELDEEQFFDLSIATVRDILIKLNTALHTHPQKEEHLTWGSILNNPFKKQITSTITIRQTLLAKIANFPFALIMVITARALFFLKVKGGNNIPKEGPFIFCPNHSSFLDGPLLVSSLNFTTQLNTYFLGYSAYFNKPFVRWAKKLFRLIPIDPASKLADTLTLCAFVLKNSKILCMFPEGSRSWDGEVKEFKRGIGILIKELNIPVIPVYIKGTHTAWPPSKTLPHPEKVEIIFGKKLTLEDLIRTADKNVDIYQNIANNLREELLKLK